MRKSWATSFLEIQCFIKCNLLLQVHANGHSMRPTQAAGCKQKSTDKMAEKGKGRKVKQHFLHLNLQGHCYFILLSLLSCYGSEARNIFGRDPQFSFGYREQGSF